MSEMLHGSVLVTGASGFLARHLLPSLPGAFALVRTEARADTVGHLGEGGGVIPVIGTVEDPSPWSTRVQGATTIVHAAALVRHSRRNAGEVYRTNVDGTLAMVRLAAQLRARMILVSTSGTVGCFSTPTEEADEGSPYCGDVIRRWPYYDSKMRAEIQARELSHRLGVELVIVRLPVLLGPGDHVGRSTGLIARLIAGSQHFLINGGISFTDVRDVVDGLVAIISMPTPRTIYHLPGTSWSLATFLLRCAEISGAEVPRHFLPALVARLAAQLADGASRLVGVRSSFPDPVVIEMASHYWGFRSRWSHEIGFLARPAETTLRDTIAWLRSTKKVAHEI